MTTASSTLVDGWRLATGTLTAIPVRPPSCIDRSVARAGMLLAPLATLPLALSWVACALIASVTDAPLLLAVLAAAAITLSTRAMHLDGLADTADGLSASYDREKALAVMKTGDVGPSGAAAIALTLGIQVAASSALFAMAPIAPPAVIGLGGVAFAASRLSLALACMSGIPSARPGGLGETVAGTVPRAAAVAATLFLAAVGAVVLWFLGVGWWVVPVIVAAAVTAAAALVGRATSRLGGITGDILGAGVEISYAVALTAAALASSAAL